MSTAPLITFKAGICDLDQSSNPPKVKPQARPGYIYLYSEDDLIHFCWRPRGAPSDEPELDLVMVPTDGHFIPYNTKSPENASSETNGRIFVLKFLSSPSRHLFWLQSKPQGRSGNPAWISPRDTKIGTIVDRLLQGEEVDVNAELSSVRNNTDDSDERRDDDDNNDTAMEDAGGQGDANDRPHGTTGGAGPGATGGDVRREGEDAREGGADGARAAAGTTPDAAAAVRNFLESLKGVPGFGGGEGGSAQQSLFTTLSDLLDTSVTVPMIDAASDDYVESLLAFLPPTVLVLAQQGDADDADGVEAEPSPNAAAAARAAMSPGQKRALLKKVLRSPQFHQSLGTLTVAVRDGGLPSIAEALGIAVENGGRVKGGNVPLGGGDAVEAFVEGVKKTVQRK